MEEREIRFVSTELRVNQDGGIEGYAAVFNQWSEILGWFREKVRPGAFRKSLKKDDVRALFNHDSNYVLGRNKSGTLELSEDDHGLHFKADPPDTQWANDLRVSIQRGDINQGSFQFGVVQDQWWTTPNESKIDERELIEVNLYDVSVVTFPAYPQTSISARSLAHQFIRTVSQNSDPEALAYMREQLSQLEASSESGRAPSAEESQADPEGVDASILAAHRKRRLQLERLKILEK